MKKNLITIMILYLGLCGLSCTDNSQNPSYDDGALSVSGTVEDGNYLSLSHDPGLDDLTFTAQFMKDDCIYDYSDYSAFFGRGMALRSGPVDFTGSPESYTKAVSMVKDNILIAYSDEGNGYYGTFVVCDSSGNRIGDPVIFNKGYTAYTSAVPLSGGNVILTYGDVNSSKGMVTVYNSSGEVVTAPVTFQDSSVSSISATPISAGKVLIAYCNVKNSNYGTFVLCWANGTLTGASIIFNEAATTNISTTTLPGGNALITYTDGGNSDKGTFVIYNPSGTTVLKEFVFNDASTSSISATTMSNGNVLIAYSDGGNSNYGTCVIYSSAGSLVAGPVVFFKGYSNYISATAMADGGALIAYQAILEGGTRQGMAVICDSTGNITGDPAIYTGARCDYVSAAPLSDGRAAVAYQDSSASKHGAFCVLGGKSFQLRRVAPGEVRLYNYTGESLEMVLSAYR